MTWEMKTDRPIYLQLIEQIKRRIVSGEFPAGSQLPPVRALAEQAAVNPNTMQKAFSELEREGLVFTQRTSGSFITEDEDMIEQLKTMLAQEVITEFFLQMNGLGFTKEDAIHLIESTAKEQNI